MIERFISAVSALSRAFAVIATLLLIAAMVVVCQMILMRYVFRAATIWQTDFVIFAATAATFLGAPYVLLKKGHVGVDFIELMLKPAPRRALKIVGSILGLVFCVVMLVASAINFEEAWAGGWKHASVWAPPLWIPMASVPLGFGMLCLQYLAEIAKLATAPLETRGRAIDEIAAGGDAVTAHVLKEQPR
jgi:TRAP-type C4-dicarboxylate transport system permease small subunit